MTGKEQGTLVEQNVTYTLEINGKFFLIEDVPARVSVETGEQLFAPQTVERLQQIVLGESAPLRVVETPVFNYAG